jgi:hypothetical protein
LRACADCAGYDCSENLFFAFKFAKSTSWFYFYNAEKASHMSCADTTAGTAVADANAKCGKVSHSMRSKRRRNCRKRRQIKIVPFSYELIDLPYLPRPNGAGLIASGFVSAPRGAGWRPAFDECVRIPNGSGTAPRRIAPESFVPIRCARPEPLGSQRARGKMKPNIGVRDG